MKQKLVSFLKYNRFAYSIYYNVVSFMINFLRIFIRTDDRLILFNSFAGRKFDDSPKAVYDHMKDDPRFEGYRLVWAFHDPGAFKDTGVQAIRTDGLNYFTNALKARVWVTNSSFERGLNFRGKNTLYFNTWHGTPIKKMGSDISGSNETFRSKTRNKFDIMMSQGRFETEIFSRTFRIPKEKFLEAGYPRNDILANYTPEYRNSLREKLNVPADKKVILYCPTFREYDRDENNGVVLAPPMDLKRWEEELKDDHVLFFRAHYEVSRVMKIEENDFIRNMTDYPSLNDLMIASDILISDYSSVFFDYSIMDKPMLHFTYDFDRYASERGMYFDIREWIDGADNEEELIGLINSMDPEASFRKTEAFRGRFVNFYGSAAKAAADCIAEKIGI